MTKRQGKPEVRRRRNIALMTAVLTVAAVLLFIGCNYLATTLEKRYALSADLSYNALTLQSAVTEETLKTLDKPISMYLMTAATGDTFGDSVLSRSDLRTILERYRRLSPMLSYEEISLMSAPSWSTRFSESLNGSAITEDCVVLHCGTTGRTRMLTADDFLRRQYDLDSQTFVVSAYAVEKAMTEGIVYVSSDTTPGVQILTGHGELGEADTNILVKHLNDAGYEVFRVSLHDRESLSPEQPLLVLCPQFDLTEEELAWIQDWMQDGGGLLYVTSYTSPTALPRFNALLGAYGLAVRPGIVVASGADKTSYYSDSLITLLPYMQAAPETQELLGSGQDILLMPGVRAVTISDDRDTDIYAESLLKSGDAYLRLYEDGRETLERQEGDETGVFDLAALARRYDGDQARGTVIAVGNAAMFTEEWIYENTYQDAFLRVLLKALSTGRPVSLDISVKSAVRSGLSLGPLGWAIWLAVLLPLLIAAAALIVLLPRRHL